MAINDKLNGKEYTLRGREQTQRIMTRKKHRIYWKRPIYGKHMGQAITSSIQYTMILVAVCCGAEKRNDVFLTHCTAWFDSICKQHKNHIKHSETNIGFYENDVANWRCEYFDSFSVYQHILSIPFVFPVGSQRVASPFLSFAVQFPKYLLQPHYLNRNFH